MPLPAIAGAGQAVGGVLVDESFLQREALDDALHVVARLVFAAGGAALLLALAAQALHLLGAQFLAFEGDALDALLHIRADEELPAEGEHDRRHRHVAASTAIRKSWLVRSFTILVHAVPQKSNATILRITRTPMVSMTAAMPSHILPVGVVTSGSR